MCANNLRHLPPSPVFASPLVPSPACSLTAAVARRVGQQQQLTGSSSSSYLSKPGDAALLHMHYKHAVRKPHSHSSESTSRAGSTPARLRASLPLRLQKKVPLVFLGPQGAASICPRPGQSVDIRRLLRCSSTHASILQASKRGRRCSCASASVPNGPASGAGPYSRATILCTNLVSPFVPGSASAPSPPPCTAPGPHLACSSGSGTRSPSVHRARLFMGGGAVVSEMTRYTGVRR